MAVVGAPIRNGDALYNCAVVIGSGAGSWALCPRPICPTTANTMRNAGSRRPTARVRRHGDRFERRDAWTSRRACCSRPSIGRASSFSVDICEDYLGAAAALDAGGAGGGADPAEPVGVQHRHRQGGRAGDAERQPFDARTLSAYVFAASGWGESTTDLAWDGQATIHELGSKLAEGERFALGQPPDRSPTWTWTGSGWIVCATAPSPNVRETGRRAGGGRALRWRARTMRP